MNDVILQFQPELAACLHLESSRKAAGEKLNPQGRAALLLAAVDAVYKARGRNTDVQAHEQAFVEIAQEIRRAIEQQRQESHSDSLFAGAF